MLIRQICCHLKKIKSITRVTSHNYTTDKDLRLVWLDLEMTGLNVSTDHILEIGCVITDEKLNIVAMEGDITIHQPDNVLNNMGPWCTAQHKRSGLTEASRNSKITLREAEKQVVEFVSKYVDKQTCPLVGNSIYTDRMFLASHMPTLDLFLHYRLIDVTTIKELAKRWFPDILKDAPPKKHHHRCLNDIIESINEMKFYRRRFFINNK